MVAATFEIPIVTSARVTISVDGVDNLPGIKDAIRSRVEEAMSDCMKPIVLGETNFTTAISDGLAEAAASQQSVEESTQDGNDPAEPIEEHHSEAQADETEIELPVQPAEEVDATTSADTEDTPVEDPASTDAVSTDSAQQPIPTDAPALSSIIRAGDCFIKREDQRQPGLSYKPIPVLEVLTDDRKVRSAEGHTSFAALDEKYRFVFTPDSVATGDILLCGNKSVCIESVSEANGVVARLIDSEQTAPMTWAQLNECCKMLVRSDTPSVDDTTTDKVDAEIIEYPQPVRERAGKKLLFDLLKDGSQIVRKTPKDGEGVLTVISTMREAGIGEARVTDEDGHERTLPEGVINKFYQFVEEQSCSSESASSETF